MPPSPASPEKKFVPETQSLQLQGSAGNSFYEKTSKKRTSFAPKGESNGGNLGFEEKLWSAANKMRGQMDPSEYKHIVLGLIFLKYISDAFEEHYLYLDAEDAEFPQNYLNDNIFWVPRESRWSYLQDNLKNLSVGKLVDKAMQLLEQENCALKGVLPLDYTRPSLSCQRLAELINLIGTIDLGSKKARSQDIIGRVYEYFLSRFAGSEGNKGGEFYTPRSVVRLLVEMLEPYSGRVYDPCCGSGGMFVQSEEFILQHGGKSTDISLYGQESNPTTWRLAKMNMAIRGLNANLGECHADTFHKDLHIGMQADYILANPPFNMSYWGGDRIRTDDRWQYGVPSEGNANFAWLQHIVHHLAPGGVAGIVLANGSLTSNSGGEGEIRKAMIQGGLVDCIVSLPGQLFYGTSIAASLWIIARSKKGQRRHRKGETLFIDARNLGQFIDRTHREFSDADIQNIADAYHRWRHSNAQPFQDSPGFARSATRNTIQDHKWALVPGRYVGFDPQIQMGPDATELLANFKEVEERLLKVSDASRHAVAILRGILHG